MNLLDRYIARQFVLNAGALAVMLACFVVAVDVSLNLDRFQERARELAGVSEEDGGGGLREAAVVVLIVGDLWWPRLLQLMNFLIGFVMVGAMGFTCVQLTRHRELLAMVAAGVSLHRVARPLFLVAGLVSAVQVANQELLIPRIAPLLVRDHGDAGERAAVDIPVPLTADGRGAVLRARWFDAGAGRLDDVFIVERGGDRQAARVITAASATWREGGWDLDRGVARPRGGTAGEAVRRFETSIDPARITMDRHRSFEQSLSFAQATRMLARGEPLERGVRDRLERIRFGRFGVIACNLLAMAVAMPFFVSRVPTGMLPRVLLALPVVGLTLIGGVLGASAAVPGLPAWLGVFVPALVLAPMALGAVTWVRT